MFLANCSFEWGARVAIKEKLSEADYEAVRAKLPQLEMPAYASRSEWYGLEEFVLDAEDVQFLLERGLKLEMRKIKGVVQEHPKAMMGQPFPNLAIISVPNIALFEVRYVTLLENACTQDLQRYLDQGWRILCVCPPNDQRRPDYILGRMEKP